MKSNTRAVLQAVVGDALHAAVLVEIDRHHPLVGHVLVEEGDAALGSLRDVIEDLAAQRRDGGGRAEHDQHLVLAGADRNLLQRAVGQHIALLELLGAAGERRAGEGERQRLAQARACAPSRKIGEEAVADHAETEPFHLSPLRGRRTYLATTPALAYPAQESAQPALRFHFGSAGQVPEFLDALAVQPSQTPLRLPKAHH